MRFDMRRSIVGGASADADPRTSPGSVIEDALLRIPFALRNTDGKPTRLLLAAEGTSGQAVGLEIYAMDEPLDPGAALDTVPSTIASAARRFYQATTATQTITVGTLREYTANLPAAGVIYVRVVTVPAANATVLVAVG